MIFMGFKVSFIYYYYYLWIKIIFVVCWFKCVCMYFFKILILICVFVLDYVLNDLDISLSRNFDINNKKD